MVGVYPAIQQNQRLRFDRYLTTYDDGSRSAVMPNALISAAAVTTILQQKRSGPLQLSVLILPAKGPNFIRSNLRTRTILDARGRSPDVRSGSPFIVRRRSRRSLPRLHLNDFWQFTRSLRRKRLLAVAERLSRRKQ